MRSVGGVLRRSASADRHSGCAAGYIHPAWGVAAVTPNVSTHRRFYGFGGRFYVTPSTPLLQQIGRHRRGVRAALDFAVQVAQQVAVV